MLIHKYRLLLFSPKSYNVKLQRYTDRSEHSESTISATLLQHFFILSNTKSHEKGSGLSPFSLVLLRGPELAKPTTSASHFTFSREADATRQLGPSPGGRAGNVGEEGAVGTLNLLGWLSGTLSLFRQLQQLPMVSEQPARPREKHKGQEGHRGQLPKALLWGTLAEPPRFDHLLCLRLTVPPSRNSHSQSRARHTLDKH